MKEIKFTGEQMVYFARYCFYKRCQAAPLQALHSLLIEFEKTYTTDINQGIKLTIGNLIDQLSIENIRIWFAEDIKRKGGATDKEIADATRITNVANMKRNALIQAIDEALGQQSFKQGDNKMYGK